MRSVRNLRRVRTLRTLRGEDFEESEEHEDLDATSQQYDVQESEGLQWLVATQVTRGVSYSVTGYHHRP